MKWGKSKLDWDGESVQIIVEQGNAPERFAPVTTKDESTITWTKNCTDCGCRYKASMSTLMGRFPIPVSVFKANVGQCPECREKQKVQLEKLNSARNLHWTYDLVKKHFTANPPSKGQELLVLDTSWNTNTYALVTVANPEHTKQKRIVIDYHTNGYSGQSFYRSGKNCFSPKGQVRLLPYNTVIGDLIKKGDNKEIRLEPKEILNLVGKKP